MAEERMCHLGLHRPIWSSRDKGPDDLYMYGFKVVELEVE